MMQFFGPAISVSVANNLFNSKLIGYIEALKIPGLDVHNLVQGGATIIRRVVPREYVPSVIEAYMRALRWTFRISLILSCLSIFGVLAMEWRKIKGPDAKEETGSEASES